MTRLNRRVLIAFFWDVMGADLARVSLEALGGGAKDLRQLRMDFDEGEELGVIALRGSDPFWLEKARKILVAAGALAVNELAVPARP